MIGKLPQKLRTLREKFGFSQKQVATALGVSQSIISSYENGERTPSTQALLSLAYLYRCSTDYLLGRDTAYQFSALSTEGLSPDQVAALQALIASMRNEPK